MRAMKNILTEQAAAFLALTANSKRLEILSLLRRSKLAKTAGVIVDDIGDLRYWAEDHYLPDSLDELEPFTTYAVPYDYDAFKDVEALILTTLHQIQWIGQLAKMPGWFVLHIDGKHKVHHGG